MKRLATSVKIALASGLVALATALAIGNPALAQILRPSGGTSLLSPELFTKVGSAIVTTSASDTLGSSSRRIERVYAYTIDAITLSVGGAVSGDFAVGGNTTLGDGTSDRTVINGKLGINATPSAELTLRGLLASPLANLFQISNLNDSARYLTVSSTATIVTGALTVSGTGSSETAFTVTASNTRALAVTDTTGSDVFAVNSASGSATFYDQVRFPNYVLTSNFNYVMSSTNTVVILSNAGAVNRSILLPVCTNSNLGEMHFIKNLDNQGTRWYIYPQGGEYLNSLTDLGAEYDIDAPDSNLAGQDGSSTFVLCFTAGKWITL